MTSPYFDPALLHQGAAEAINKDAAGLLTARQIGTIKPSEPAFQSRRVVKGTVTDKDLADEPLLAWSNLAGQTVERYFGLDGKLIALRDEGYKLLRRLVERVKKTKPFSTGLSDSFLEIEIFKWWRATIRAEIDRSLSEQLLEVCAAAIQPYKMLVPLSNLEIERPFILGDVLVTPLDAHLFSEFAADGAHRFPEHADVFRQEAEQMRNELGHLTAVCVESVGDLVFAQDRARAVAFDMADFMRFMSPAAASHNIIYACFPYGCEHEPSTTVLELKEGKLGIISSGKLDRSNFRWKLSSTELDGHMQDGFRHCAVFFEKAPLTGFEQRVKTAISAYSQGLAAAEIRNRQAAFRDLAVEGGAGQARAIQHGPETDDLFLVNHGTRFHCMKVDELP